MSAVISECLRCNAPLESSFADGLEAEARCPKCGSLQIHYRYPVYVEEAEASPRSIVLDEGTTCFFHETAGAANICDDCGRYLCELCTLPIPKPANSPAGFPTKVCPACFAHRADEEDRGALWDLFQTEYPRYDIMALLLFVVPMGLVLTFVFTPITTPIALFIAIRNWRRCRNPLTRFRFYLAVAIGVHLVVVFLWTLAIVMIVATVMGAA